MKWPSPTLDDRTSSQGRFVERDRAMYLDLRGLASDGEHGT
ncbi:hypothetical protein [Billgrantia endophytica]|nr:hypothetical protein [Halomonas endophytica]